MFVVAVVIVCHHFIILKTLRINQFLEKVNPNEFAGVDELAKEIIGAIKNPRNQTTNAPSSIHSHRIYL